MVTQGEKDATLHARAGVSRVHMSRLRRGKNKPSKDTAITLQEITGIPAMDLMLDEANA